MASNSKQSLHMNPGQGETSYAQNSVIQKTAQERMKTLIEEAMTGLYNTATSSSPLHQKELVIADLGCSSGPNALTLVSAAVDAVVVHRRHCAGVQQLPPPELCVFLNDLPDNDFNTVAKSLAALKQSARPAAMVTAGMIPGSFYDRLFPRASLHLVCSANSLHWLSTAPEDLKSGGIPMYESDEQTRPSRLQVVLDSYGRQFRKDFMQFLSSRAQELVPGGRMVVSLLVKRSDEPDPELTQPWTTVMMALCDMAMRGVISKEKFDSFYVPMYCPVHSEVCKIIEEEGSFEINKTVMHEPFDDTYKAMVNLKMMSLGTRAVFEPIIAQHFAPTSEQVMDEFMAAVERQLRISRSLEARLSGESPFAFLCLALTRAIR